MFVAKIEYYDEYEGKEIVNDIFVSGDSLSDSLSKLINFYGEDSITSVSLAPFNPDGMLIFKENHKELFNIVKTFLEKEVVW